jgi:hypothetical protein
MLRSHLPTGPAAESVAGLVESWPESGCRRAEQVLIYLKVTSTGPGFTCWTGSVVGSHRPDAINP